MSAATGKRQKVIRIRGKYLVLDATFQGRRAKILGYYPPKEKTA